MAQKIITIIFAIAVIGGLAWYINKNYVAPTSSGASIKVIGNTSATPKATESSKAAKTENLIYANFGNANEIWSVDLSSSKKKIFTDTDEAGKIQMLSNVATTAEEVLAVTSSGSKANGSLSVVNLMTAKETQVRQSFVAPENLTISSDGRLFAYTRFSNIEQDYGYTLFWEKVSDGSATKAYNSSSTILAPAFSPSGSKIAFAEVGNNSTELKSYSISAAKPSKIAAFEGKVIDWISWDVSDKIIVSVRKNGNNNAGEIDAIDPNSGSVSKLAEFNGGRAIYTYLNNSGHLAFIVAQYNNKLDQQISGQMYIVNLNDKSKTTLDKANQILGWR